MTIWKFPLKVTDRQIVNMPDRARILSAQFQGSTLCLWALVAPRDRERAQVIRIYGTGHDITEDSIQYIGTVQIGPLVWRVFEEIDL